MSDEIKGEFSNIDLKFYCVNISIENEVQNFFESIDQNINVTTLLNAAAKIHLYLQKEWWEVQILKILI
ncbi:hypothetical protein CM15mP35_07810 [bacterium]|nr:MAG: hypothetical protein CM15mP35_07810 [bacterium]